MILCAGYYCIVLIVVHLFGLLLPVLQQKIKAFLQISKQSERFSKL